MVDLALISQILKTNCDVRVAPHHNVTVDKSSSPKSVIITLTDKYNPKNIKRVSVSKLNILNYLNLERIVLKEQHQYTTTAILEIAKQYDLNITAQDVVNERIKSNEFTIKIAPHSTYFYGDIHCTIYTELQDVIAFFDNVNNVVSKEPVTKKALYMYRHLSFTYMDTLLNSLPTMDGLPEEVVEQLRYRVPELNFKNEPCYLNLYGGMVVYNKPTNAPFTKCNRVIGIGLDNRLCTGVNGIVEFYY